MFFLRSLRYLLFKAFFPIRAIRVIRGNTILVPALALQEIRGISGKNFPVPRYFLFKIFL
jgi:hypothetical protein